MSDLGSATSRLGRPRDPRADAAILQAVLEIAAESGLAALTMEAVAHRAGVGKNTIYRRWSGKEAMVLEALHGLVTPVTVPDTGSLPKDLEMLLGQFAIGHSDSLLRRALPQLVAAARFNPELEHTLAEFIAERRKPMQTLLRRAVDRGEIRDDRDLGLVHDLLVGPLFYRALMSGAPTDQAYLEALVEVVLEAATPASQ